MTRWLALKGENYAVGLITYTVTLTYDDGKPLYQAWRFNTKPATLIGTFASSDEAKSHCEKDAA